MAQYNLLTAGWHRWERQALRVSATPGEGATLRWVLLAHGRPLMEVLDAGIDAGPTGYVDVNVGGDDDAATALAYANVPAGLYRYELWDTASATLLTYGDVLLLPGVEPAEEEE
jgi:hypothetical protein